MQAASEKNTVARNSTEAQSANDRNVDLSTIKIENLREDYDALSLSLEINATNIKSYQKNFEQLQSALAKTLQGHAHSMMTLQLKSCTDTLSNLIKEQTELNAKRQKIFEQINEQEANACAFQRCDSSTNDSLNQLKNTTISKHLKLAGQQLLALDKRIDTITAEFASFKNIPAEDESDACTTPKNNTQGKNAIDHETLEIMERSQKALITDMNKIQKSFQMLSAKFEGISETLRQTREERLELYKQVTLAHVGMLAIEERLINQEKGSRNGTLLFKLDHVAEKIVEAKKGRQTSFYTPPFYTSQNGYKMCARIYLNGDGDGKNTHMSVFFVLLRSEHDAILRWPFKQKVTFKLYDQQNNNRENIVDAFRPDLNSKSFAQPETDMNIASGLPLFVPQAKLFDPNHAYIKNNTMFLKVIVDTKDLEEV